MLKQSEQIKQTEEVQSKDFILVQFLSLGKYVFVIEF